MKWLDVMQNIRKQHLHMLQWQRFISHCTKLRGKQHKQEHILWPSYILELMWSNTLLPRQQACLLLYSCFPVLSHCALFPPVHQLCNHLIAHWTYSTHQSSRNEKKKSPFWLTFELNLLSTWSVKHNRKREPVQQRTKGWRPKPVPFCNT